MLDEENNARLPQISQAASALRKVDSVFPKGHRDRALLLASTHGQGLWDSLGGRCTIDPLCSRAHLLLESPNVRILWETTQMETEIWTPHGFPFISHRIFLFSLLRS